MFSELAQKTMRFTIRRRVSIQDLFLIAAAVAVTAYALYEVDLFVVGDEPIGKFIELDELPLIGAVLSIGMLIFSWRRSAEQKRETQRRIVAERHARELAMQDPLTGLPNRRQLSEALDKAVASPPRTGGSHALLTLDLNGFKQINDVHGHGAGDQALIVVGERLLAAVRPGDLVARLGGDEFAVLAQHLAGAEDATSVARRIIDALAAPITTATATHNVGAGIGIAMLPFPQNTPEEVMRRSDVALYRAKADRKSSMRFFDDEMDRHVRERDQMERELREAIETRAIRPMFQPLIDLRTKSVVGFETLPRWTHNGLGEIAPDRFIPIAEETGLIGTLSDQLLRGACEAARGWPADTTLAFGISPAQLRDRTLGLRVLGILSDTGLRPSRLEIGITEAALVREVEAVRESLGVLRNVGVRIALGDFGTGYSSLYHLRNFKIDKIKIDRGFVRRMGVEHESAAIVTALVGLGRGLGMTVTAEGIEGEVGGAELLARGFQQGQGRQFGDAVPADKTLAFFNQAKAAG